MTKPIAASERQPMPPGASDDAALVARVLARDRGAFEQLMRRHNSALYRAARAILRNDADAEDALQDAYLAAYRHLGEFRAESRLATWLTRIVINQSLARLRVHRRDRVVVFLDEREPDGTDPLEQAMDQDPVESPEAGAMRTQMRCLLERKIDALPLAFRTAFILREVDELTIDEVAECLGVPAATVRTRVFRARSLLRAALAEEIDVVTGDVFSFAGDRCDRIVAGTLARLAALEAAPPDPPTP